MSLPTSTLMAPVIAPINHVLAQQGWASAQLARHAGKIVCFDAGSAALRLRVGADGLFEAASFEVAANVTVRLKLSDLPLMLQNRERAFSLVTVEGDADFANTISQLSKTVRWEAEHDLERLVGAIAARRLAAGARAAIDTAAAGQRKLAENLAEFFLEEQPMLVRPAAVDAFSAGVTRLRDDVERTAKRLDKLLAKLNAPDGALSASPSLDR
jgi:ubiquinone biosynthesis accessory factor UbiJ